GDYALVTVTAGHLVARLNTTLDGEVDLDDLEHARREVVALSQLALLVLETLVEVETALLELLRGLLELLGQRVVLQTQLEPVLLVQFVEVLRGENVALL